MKTVEQIREAYEKTHRDVVEIESGGLTPPDYLTGSLSALAYVLGEPEGDRLTRTLRYSDQIWETL